jgi:hypothetical protein
LEAAVHRFYLSDAADLAADSVNLFGDLMVEAIEVGIMAGFHDEAVMDRLSVWDQILPRKKFVSLFREGKDLLRVRFVPLDTSLLDESLSAKVLNVTLHP